MNMDKLYKEKWKRFLYKEHSENNWDFCECEDCIEYMRSVLRGLRKSVEIMDIFKGEIL